MRSLKIFATNRSGHAHVLETLFGVSHESLTTNR